MEILKAKLESSVGRAEEYRLLGKNHPEGLRVHIEYITDLLKSLIVSLRGQPISAGVDCNELLAEANKTLNNLQDEFAAEAEQSVVAPALSKVREKLDGLSDLKLPSFDGNYNKFDDFMTCFTGLMINDVSIASAVRMIVLRSCLTGEPLDLVSAFPISPTNYSLTLKFLNDVYGGSSKCLYTRNLYQSLIRLPRVSMHDGVKFQETFRKLESILQSMSKRGVDVDNDLCLRFVYLRQFSGKTLVAVLVKDPEMSLPEIRREIRHLVNVEELYLKTGEEAGNGFRSGEKPVVAEVGTEKSTNVDGDKESRGAGTNANPSTATKRKEESTPKSIKSDDQCSAKKGKIEKSGMSLSTVCTNVTYLANERTTSVRLLLQNYAPISLISEHAARRLGINVPRLKTLRLRSSLGFEFSATQEAYKVILQVGEKGRVLISAHIVENKFGFSAEDVPAADVDDFLKDHPDLSYVKIEDAGRGRPIDFFLSGDYFWDYMVPEGGRVKLQPVKFGWRLQLTKFGWLLHGPVECNGKLIVCSYGYPDSFNVHIRG